MTVDIPIRSLRNGSFQPPAAVDIACVESLSKIRSVLQHLQDKEQAVTRSLNDLIASQNGLARQLSRLDLARAQLGPQVNSARSIGDGMLGPASSSASRLSAAVKSLDDEQSAVKATLRVVEEVAELKACVLGINGAMEGTQDWELAATYLHRASKIPADIIDGAFAEEIVPTAEVPDPPRLTLDNASENLCALFLREFDRAVKEGNGANVTRFFKLFPLIGRQDTGLDAYGRYVCGGVASRARNNLSSAQRPDGLFYAGCLTKLFEHMAQIIEGHEPIVTRHYGAGMMIRVMERLQSEADVQGGLIVNTWWDEGQTSRLLTDIKAYAFTFLVQSFLPSQKPQSAFRSSSPAVHDRTDRASEDDGGISMKTVDSRLNESAIMLGRWALYTKFLASKMQKDSQYHVPNLIIHSSLQGKISDYLIGPFTAMTTFLFRRSVEKAFQMDEAPDGLTLNPTKQITSEPPHITSVVDDVMYILNQVLQRSLATSQRSIISGVVPSIGRVLSSDFYGMVQRKMRDECYPKASNQGPLPPEALIISFIVQMNNLDVSTDYVSRIVEGLVGLADEETRLQGLRDRFPFDDDAMFVQKQVRGMFQAFSTKTDELLNEAVEVLLRQVLRPRLRPVIVDSFRDVKYDIGDTDAVRASDDDDVESAAERFERGWSAFIQPIKRISTAKNFARLLNVTVLQVSRLLEKRIWGQAGKVTAMGAIQMERDITEIIGVAIQGGKYSLRDHFAKVVQMLLIMNMDEEEWEISQEESDNTGQGSTPWILDKDERRRVRDILQ